MRFHAKLDVVLQDNITNIAYWTMQVSTTIISVGYFAIAYFLLQIVRARPDLRFRAVFTMIAVFAISYGVTQLSFLLFQTRPDFLYQSLFALLAAIAIIATCIFLYFLVPHAINIPSIQALEAAHQKAFTSSNLQMKAEKRFKAVIDCALDAFVAISAGGKISYWNSQAETLFGWTREEALGAPFDSIFVQTPSSNSDSISLANIIMSPLHANYSNRLEISIVHRDGRCLPVEVAINKVEQDDTFVFALFFHNISERKQIRKLQSIQLEFTRQMSTAESVDDSLENCLRVIGEGFDWDVAEFWEISSSGDTVAAAHIWHRPGESFKRFADACKNKSYPTTYCLASSVFLKGKVVNLANIHEYAHPSRINEMNDAGIKHLLVCPIWAGKEVIGALALLSRGDNLVDQAAIENIQDLCASLGAYLLRRRAEFQVMRSERRFRELVEAISDGIFILDTNGQILSCNSAAERMTGYEDGGLIGHSLGKICGQSESESFDVNHALQIARTKSRFQYENACRRYDGGVFHADISITPTFNERNDLSGFAALLRDVSERKELEIRQQNLKEELEALVVEKTKALIQSENRMRIISNALPVAIIYCDSDNYLKFANETFRKWRNISVKDTQTLRASEVLNPDVFQNIQAILNTETPDQVRTYELEVQHPDRKRLLEVINVPDRDVNSQRIRGVISVMTDVTGQRRVENLLRTSKEAADDANLAKSAFIANMSHEIRTPLGAILGYSDLLAEPGLSRSERDKFLFAIKSNGELLSRIINDILDLSKVEAGRMDIEKSTVSINEVIGDLRTPISILARDKGIEFNITIEHNVPKIINTDPLRLRQILLNIVGNAVKFTESGNVTLNVSLETPGSPSSKLLFAVTDTGLGIDMDHAQHLFQPFSQVDISSKRKFGGTGLGLALAQRLAQQLGGDVFLAESVPGVGSKFVVTIDPGPILESSYSTVVTSVIPPSNNGLAGFTTMEDQLAGLRVLLVEDSPDIQFLVRRFLSSAGALVDTADNGKEAMDQAHHNSYDVILMDLQMPVMDGYEALTRLRSEGLRSPIIALTAHAMVEERMKCLKIGFSDHLGKPVDRKLLLDCISQNCKSLH